MQGARFHKGNGDRITSCGSRVRVSRTQTAVGVCIKDPMGQVRASIVSKGLRKVRLSQ